MLLAGKLDATLLYLTDNNLVDRSRDHARGQSRRSACCSRPAAEGQRYYEKTGIFPINHGMVVRRSIYEQHPWVALNLFNAFRLAKERAAARMRELISTHVELGLLGPDAAQGAERGPVPVRRQVEPEGAGDVAQYSHEQGLTPRRHAAGRDLRPEYP